jgi:hypothetical protein
MRVTQRVSTSEKARVSTRVKSGGGVMNFRAVSQQTGLPAPYHDFFANSTPQTPELKLRYS